MSLDAPLVAIVWQHWWARATGTRPEWGCDLILGLGVWMIYLADRLADTVTFAAGVHETTRHAFYRYHQHALRGVLATVLLALVWLVPRVLPFRQFLFGLGLLSLAGGYFWLIHRRARRSWSRSVPKEAVVGAMFASGTGFFALVRGQYTTPALLVAMPLFAALCFFNCSLITKWERNQQDVQDDFSLLNAFPRLTPMLGGVCLCLSLLALIIAVIVPHGTVLAPIVAGSLLLAGLDTWREWLSVDALRVLADAVLLTPWLYLILLHHGL